MLRRMKIWWWRFKQRLPQYKVLSDYYQMLKKLKELERQLQEKAEQVELAKSSFLKNIYHEIRTPLNAIVGFTNLLEKDKKQFFENKDLYIEQINNSSCDFLKVMDDIIQASLLEAGLIEVKKNAGNLEVLMSEIYYYNSVRKHIIEKSNIAFLMNVPDVYRDLNAVYDKNKVHQILSHLIDNAFKFTEKGVVEYGYKVKNNNLEFYVKDSCKIDLNGKAKNIFNRFTKTELPDNAERGLGIGLYNCKKLVELMGGAIGYTSNPGKGNRFYFTIPYERSEPVEEENEFDSFGKHEELLLKQNSFI